MTTWPSCSKCGKTILTHQLWGIYAYCDTVRGPESRASFSVTEVNEVHRTLGHKLSATMIEEEAAERQITGQQKMDLA